MQRTLSSFIAAGAAIAALSDMSDLCKKTVEL
jgi:hypothetical protein